MVKEKQAYQRKPVPDERCCECSWPFQKGEMAFTEDPNDGGKPDAFGHCSLGCLEVATGGHYKLN